VRGSMDLVTDSVNRLEEFLERSGCEETSVQLDVDPDAKNCQFERGACMTASFGGRTAEFVTDDPIRALTRTSYMFGVPLDSTNVRSAACAIINVTTAFFCLSRVRRACPVKYHSPCAKELKEQLSGRIVFCIGEIPSIERMDGVHITRDIAQAEIILVNNSGIIEPNTGDLIAEHKKNKRVLYLGPSTSGICRLQQGEHWCPYGQPMPDSVPDPSK